MPLQVGAPTHRLPPGRGRLVLDLADRRSPRLIASYAINGGPGGGRSEGVDLWIVALAAMLVALMLGAACVLTTVIALRAPGMDLARVPMFAWSMLVAGAMWLV